VNWVDESGREMREEISTDELMIGEVLFRVIRRERQGHS